MFNLIGYALGSKTGKSLTAYQFHHIAKPPEYIRNTGANFKMARKVLYKELLYIGDGLYQ